MSSISVQTNVKDRIFVIQNNQIWERRYNNGNWEWVAHHALNDSIKPLALGPCMINTTENVGRLFIQVSKPTASGGSIDYKTEWLMYNFNPTQTDYSSFSNFQIGAYSPTEAKIISVSSNLTVSSDWKIYGMVALNRVDLSIDRQVGLSKFDIDLNSIDKSELYPADPFEIGFSGTGYITEHEANRARPSIMSNHDVFFCTGKTLHHANYDMNTSKHGSKQFYDVSDAFDDMCFALKTNGDLFARRFDAEKHKWVWDKHGCPIKKSHFKDHYRVGSLRKFNDGVLFAIKPTWSDEFRIYHRWRDESGAWHWADHGYPDNESIIDIGPAYDDKFFIITESGKLYERDWNDNVGNWAWENHGIA